MCKCKKWLFLILLGQWGGKLQLKCCQQGIERLLVETQFWGMNRQTKAQTVLLSGHGLEVNWICHHLFQMALVRGVVGTKNWWQYFPNRADTTSAHWIQKVNPNGTAFVAKRQLKSTTFTKIAEMSDCCMCSQQFTIKHEVTKLCVSQFSGEKTERSPMVFWFLLHDTADMSIWGIGGNRKFSVWGSMLEGYPRS
jgi:hypothetical protein